LPKDQEERARGGVIEACFTFPGTFIIRRAQHHRETISISSTCTPRCACLVCVWDCAVTCMAASDHKVALHSARGRQALVGFFLPPAFVCPTDRASSPPPPRGQARKAAQESPAEAGAAGGAAARFIPLRGWARLEGARARGRRSTTTAGASS